jgi:parallel beta-helix repeat protein
LAANGNCITISANNVTLDCQNNRIAGQSTGIGVYVMGASGAVVKNCDIENFITGILLGSGSNQCNVTNNIIRSNTGEGVHLYSSNNVLTNNDISYNPRGIVFEWSNNNIVVNNTVSLNSGVGAGDGVYILAQSGNNTFLNNYVTGNSAAGINVQPDCHNNIFIGNIVSSNYWGFMLAGSAYNNSVANNTFCGNNRDIECYSELIDEGGNRCSVNRCSSYITCGPCLS